MVGEFGEEPTPGPWNAAQSRYFKLPEKAYYSGAPKGRFGWPVVRHVGLWILGVALVLGAFTIGAPGAAASCSLDDASGCADVVCGAGGVPGCGDRVGTLCGLIGYDC